MWLLYMLSKAGAFQVLSGWTLGGHDAARPSLPVRHKQALTACSHCYPTDNGHIRENQELNNIIHEDIRGIIYIICTVCLLHMESSEGRINDNNRTRFV